MKTIKLIQLEQIITQINHATGNDIDTYEKGDNGGLKAIVGNYHLSQAYGGCALYQITSEGGAIADIFGCGHVSKRALYERLQSFLLGVQYGKESRTLKLIRGVS